ncbi:hypothetical protein SAMN04488124_0399 [Halogeometricum limi]|uniref:Uncharacterized protein n=2 Tax=Halogeometricum limi TaxID=555875 RepID=A0A1I6FVR8_9EURY|nr:hypothetical protein SAMN04488124_0399 [Halogeometricum limi]
MVAEMSDAVELLERAEEEVRHTRSRELIREALQLETATADDFAGVEDGKEMTILSLSDDQFDAVDGEGAAEFRIGDLIILVVRDGRIVADRLDEETDTELRSVGVTRGIL